MENRAGEYTTSRSMRNTAKQHEEEHQRRAQPMQLYYSAAKNYKKPITSETGARLRYDIQELRIRPGNMTKWYKDREKVTTEQEKKRRTRLDILQRKWRQQWAKYIQSEKRPIRRSQHGPRDWKNGDGTKQEIHQLGQSYKKERDALQQEIASHGHKIQARTNKSQQLLTIHAW